MSVHLTAVSSATEWQVAGSFESAFLLLQDRAKPAASNPNPKSQIQQLIEFSRIRCPLCKWQPKPEHRWFCAPCAYPELFYEACGACWNTFSTRGRCPGCGHQWHWTACLNCAQWSLHQDWYEEESSTRR